MKVVKGSRKLLHPPELMVWINCGLDKYESRRGFDEIIASSRIHGLDQLWFGWACQAFELLPRMGGKPPKPPWLRGAGAPLRIPPGGACTISLKMWPLVQFKICSIVAVILFRCICSVGNCSIRYLFNCPLAQSTFCSIDFCSAGFLFNGFVQMT